MSSTSCQNCETIIDTDEDPQSCVGIYFICETCREDEDVLEILYLNSVIEKYDIEATHLRKKMKILKAAIESIEEFTKGKPIGSELYSIHIQCYNALEQGK